MLERWAKIGCENATVGKNGLIIDYAQVLVDDYVVRGNTLMPIVLNHLLIVINE